MRNSTYRFTLDIHDVESQIQITAKKNDSARLMLITMMENGKPYAVEFGNRAVIMIGKPDGTKIYNDCIIRADGTIVYEFTEQTTAADGMCECEVRIYGKNNDIITSPRFTMLVTDNIYDDGQVTSQSEFTALTKAISEVNNLDIEASKEGNTTTVVISHKDGTESTVSIADGKAFTYDDFTSEQLESLKVKNDIVQTTGQSTTNVISQKAATDLFALKSDLSDAAEKVDELKGDLTMLRAQACIFENESEIIGVQVDYKNKTFTRLAGAVNMTNGSDFDRFSMFGGRRRCNVADDGTIVAWYGDADYAEDGSMGQVMVYQPKFYYLVCPVVYDPIDTGIGYHLRKANYYVSEKPRAGFRLHPAFYDANGNEIDYFLTSAYEASIWDADGGEDGLGAFLMNDEQVMTVTTDKFCSIAGVKPASGLTQNLTRPNIEQMAKNRGDGWHGDLIKQVSAEQMLMIIEMGMMNLQTAIAQGIVSISDNSAYNCSSLTGSTASIGNGTGMATETINEKGGATTTETADGKTAICWRGKENFWGNIWKFVYGINIWGNGSMGGGQPYICNDFNFSESRNSENYEAAGFTVTNANGYISAMGYSTTCDWLFIASECLGNSSLPVGDYTWLATNLNGYRITPFGGSCTGGGRVGAFCWYLDIGVGVRGRTFGGRLVYIPTKDSAVYNAAIASWKEQMAA